MSSALPFHASAADDSITIQSVVPDNTVSVGIPVTVTITVRYVLDSTDQGVIYVAFNTKEPDVYSHVSEVGQVITRGEGTHVFSVTTTPVYWESADFEVYVNLSEYPHDEARWTPLAFDVTPLFAVYTEPEEGTGPEPVYIYEPSSSGGELIIRPEALQNITDAPSAGSAISGLLSSMTAEQKNSGDALDLAALFIENAVRAGASTPDSGELSVQATILDDLTGTASMILAEADDTLRNEDVELLRKLRTNVSIKTEEKDSLTVAFPDDVSGLGFDNVTFEADFASVTVNKNQMFQGSQISIKALYPEEDEISLSGMPIRNQGDAEPRSTIMESIDRFFRSIDPLDYWSAGVIVLILILWIVLAACKHRFRAWVVPTFCLLAVAVNAYTYMQKYDGLLPWQRHGSDSLSDIDGPDESRDVDADGVEISLGEGMSATVSMKATGDKKDFLILLDENGEPQYSKYNPVTGMIDTNIWKSGMYRLREYTTNIVDVSHENELMIKAITQLAARNVMAGTIDGYFYPSKPISRAELVSAVIRAFDMLDTSAESGFYDLQKTDWYYAAVATAEKERLVEGFEDNTFRGGLDMPKDQLVAIAANTLVERMGYFIPKDIEALLVMYQDRAEIAEWYEGRVALATLSNIMIYRTDGLFAPDSIMTRGDAAIILYRVFSKVW